MGYEDAHSILSYERIICTMMMKHLSCKVLVLLLLAGCITATPVPAEAGGVFKWYNPMTWTGGDDDAKESSKKLPQKQESEQPALKPVNAQPKQEPVPSRAVQRDTKEDMVGAVLETEKGNITIQLYPKDAPETVENFKELVEDNLYIFESQNFYKRLRNAVLREGGEQSFFESAYKSFKDELNYKIIENYDESFADPSDKNTTLLISDLNIQNELITFKTNKPNQLHLIKVSYFPNWKIKNGYGPFRISPSFMAVIPKDEFVEIKFESSNVEKALNLLSILTLFGALLITYKYKKRSDNV